MDKPLGEWNTFKIRMIGERVTVVFNGETVVDNAVLENFFANKKAGYHRLWQARREPRRTRRRRNCPTASCAIPRFPKGPIQLQTHGSEIRWRNVFIREIGAEEANKELRLARCGWLCRA